EPIRPFTVYDYLPVRDPRPEPRAPGGVIDDDVGGGQDPVSNRHCGFVVGKGQEEPCAGTECHAQEPLHGRRRTCTSPFRIPKLFMELMHLSPIGHTAV